MRSIVPFVLVLVTAIPASAQIRLGPADDVEAALNGLSPGDEVILADGMYTINERFSFTATGTAAQPIVVRADDGATPHFVQMAGQNIWDIDDSEFLVLRGLEFSGGSAGLRFQGGGRDITVEDCHIHDTADVAVRMNDGGAVYARMQILRNHIHDTGGTGEGMYLGCNMNGCQVADSLIAGNYVHHTNAGDVSQGDGIELKEGSYGNIIRDNVIHDTNYPCILGYSTVGNGAPNLVERNAMWNCGDHAIQWAADATIRNNIILSANADGIASQMHQSGSPSNLVIVHNTVLAPGGGGVSIRNPTGSVVLANNAIYSMGGRAILVNGDASRVTVAGNVGTGSVQGVSGGFAPGDLAADFVAASFSGMVPNDVFPASGGALVAAGDTAHVADDDFNGTARMGVADVGAYAYGDGSNPGWTLAEGFRPPGGGTVPGADGGPMDLDAGTTPGTDGGTTPGADGGTTGDGGPGGTMDGGCGCRVGGRPRSGLGALALLAGLALSIRRRQRS